MLSSSVNTRHHFFLKAAEYPIAHAALAPTPAQDPWGLRAHRDGPASACAEQRSALPGWRVAQPGGFSRFGEFPYCSQGSAAAACSRRAANLFTLQPGVRRCRGASPPRTCPAPPPFPPAICRLRTIVSSRAWRPGRHPRGRAV